MPPDTSVSAAVVRRWRLCALGLLVSSPALYESPRTRPRAWTWCPWWCGANVLGWCFIRFKALPVFVRARLL